MDLNERYENAIKEIDEYFRSHFYDIKNKISYDQTLEEIDNYFSNN